MRSTPGESILVLGGHSWRGETEPHGEGWSLSTEGRGGGPRGEMEAVGAELKDEGGVEPEHTARGS